MKFDGPDALFPQAHSLTLKNLSEEMGRGVGVEYMLGIDGVLAMEILTLNFHYHTAQKIFPVTAGRVTTLTPFKIDVAAHAFIGRMIMNYKIGRPFHR
jgi:hypothetical protein